MKTCKMEGPKPLHRKEERQWRRDGGELQSSRIMNLEAKQMLALLLLHHDLLKYTQHSVCPSHILCARGQ